MNNYAMAQLAEIRRQDLISDATIYRQARTHRTNESDRSRRHPRCMLNAFRGWVAAGQL